MKTVLVDSASAILLYHANLLDPLVTLYNPVIARSVFKEITVDGYPGSETLSEYCHLGRIKIMRNSDGEAFGFSPAEKGEIGSLNRGERDTIHLFNSTDSNFILIDDGKAAKLLRRLDVPFINALLFPKVLYENGYLSKDLYSKSTNLLIKRGRYAKWVIDWALSSEASALLRFAPD